MTTRNELGSLMLQTLFEILEGHPEGLHKSEVWNRILGKNPDLEESWSRAGEGKTNAFTRFTWDSTGAVKAGWLRKDGNGKWQLTGAGIHVFKNLPDRKDIGILVHTRYQQWDQNKNGYELACDLIQTLPEGWWVSLEDIAEQIDVDHAALMHYLSAKRPEGWHRVLNETGAPPECAHFTNEEHAEARKLLDSDGIRGPHGWTLNSHRLSHTELMNQISAAAGNSASKPPGMHPRAWLLRGTDEAGNSLVRSLWLAQGVCSISATSAGTLRAGMGIKAVQESVDLSHDHWPPEERVRLAFRLHAFVSRIQSGDIVLTNIGQEVHLGRVTSAELRFDGTEIPDRLLRAVEWHTSSSHLDLARDLPQELAAQVSTPNTDLLDLTDFFRELDLLLSDAPKKKSTPSPPELLPPTENLSRSLFMDREWLTEYIDLLRDRPQMIFYGPPGTGKTHLAQELARHLTGGRPENVQLIQFHPSYSYEDFFEGYRPHPGDSERSAGFVLTHGPLRTLASAARKHPNEPFVLIIDEINRGNLAKIFGELYFLLEYRNKSVRLLYGPEGDPGFDLPRNLFIIGTMNTSDRSIALVDTAMRRRFWFAELHPASEPVASVLKRWLQHHGLPDTSARLLEELNRLIDDRDFQIGPSYLMRKPIHSSDKALERVWRHQILPLLEEHHYGDGTDVPARYGLAALRESLKSDRRS